MAYHVLMGNMQNILAKIKNPKVLEIGIDLGTTFFTLAHSLTLTHDVFKITGIDIFIKYGVRAMILNWVIRKPITQLIELEETNSLDYLKDKKNFCEYDLILLNGDHNYYTVSKELEMLHKNFTKKGTVIIVDDYHGRWSKKDLWYEEREEGKKSICATKKVDTEKHGIKPAIDDFLANHGEWKFSNVVCPDRPNEVAEPIFLERTYEEVSEGKNANV
jgi:hypothetical protein